MALQIVDEFGAQAEGNYLAGDYLQQALAGKEFFETPKPRWESLHPIMALPELYSITGEDKYRQAFEHTWWSIQKNDRHNNGGFSSGEQATGNPYDPRPIETCCTIAWMALSVEMLKLCLDSRVADELELSTLNSILGMHHTSGRWATYNTPSDGLRYASAHQIVFQARPGSPELNCCSVNSPRGLGLLSDWAVLNKNGEIFLNYYGPGTIKIPADDGQMIEVIQTTAYPLDNQVELAFYPDQPIAKKIYLRIPSWSAKTRLVLNGDELHGAQPGSYFSLHRLWQPGDLIRLEFDFSPRFWLGERDCQGKVSIYRGPLLLAYDLRYNRKRKIEGDVEFKTFGADPWKPSSETLPLPKVNIGNMQFSAAVWYDWLPPRFLCGLTLEDGAKIFLCDFASAGQTGTPYHSWLPF
jgi:uncharacterized protein